MKQPREIIVEYRSILALDQLADDLQDMMEEIDYSAKKKCLKHIKKDKKVTKVNTIRYDYEVGKQIRERLIKYFNLEETTTDKEIVQILDGLLDIVKLHHYMHQYDDCKLSTLSSIRRILWKVSMKGHLYCHLKTISPDELNQVMYK